MENITERTSQVKAVSRYIEVERYVHLHVTDTGRGTPIVLLPGWPLGDSRFAYLHQDLLMYFRLIGITLRGFGKSDKPYCAYDYDVHARDIKKVLEQLDIHDAVLLGFSMGGAIAIRYVSLFSSAHVSKLVLAGAAAPVWTQRSGFPFNLKRSEVDDFIELNTTDRKKLRERIAGLFTSSENTFHENQAWLNTPGLVSTAHATAQCLYAMRDTDLRKDLKKIRIPVLILHGKNDRLCSFALAEKLNAGIRDSTLVAFEHSGHGLFLEETYKFNSELIRFAQN